MASRRADRSIIDKLGGPQIVGAGAILLAVLLWIVWPSGLSNVRNLDSTGTSIIAFGDSLTYGYGASPDQSYPSRLSSLTGVTIENAGKNGDTTASALTRIEGDVLSRNPRVVLVGLGGNDYLRKVPLDQTEENLRQIIRQIQSRGAAVILLGFRFPSLSTPYGPMYERVAEEEGALLIPDLLDGILSDPKLKSDAIHPNGAGYQIMAQRIEGPFTELVNAR